MFLDLTTDQEFLRDTTAKFLADQVPEAVLRRFAGDIPGDFEAAYWRRGADLGWTSRRVPRCRAG